MKVDIVTIFPEFFGVLDVSLLGKARERGLIDVPVHDLVAGRGDRGRRSVPRALGGLVVGDGLVHHGAGAGQARLRLLQLCVEAQPRRLRQPCRVTDPDRCRAEPRHVGDLRQEGHRRGVGADLTLDRVSLHDGTLHALG